MIFYWFYNHRTANYRLIACNENKKACFKVWGFIVLVCVHIFCYYQRTTHLDWAISFFHFLCMNYISTQFIKNNERSSQTTSVTQCLAKTYMYIIQCSKGHHYLRFKFNVGLQPRYIDLFLFYQDFISRIYRLSRISHLPSISYLAFTTHICKYIYIYDLIVTVYLVSRVYRPSRISLLPFISTD